MSVPAWGFHLVTFISNDDYFTFDSGFSPLIEVHFDRWRIIGFHTYQSEKVHLERVDKTNFPIFGECKVTNIFSTGKIFLVTVKNKLIGWFLINPHPCPSLQEWDGVFLLLLLLLNEKPYGLFWGNKFDTLIAIERKALRAIFWYPSKFFTKKQTGGAGEASPVWC